MPPSTQRHGIERDGDDIAHLCYSSVRRALPPPHCHASLAPPEADGEHIRAGDSMVPVVIIDIGRRELQRLRAAHGGRLVNTAHGSLSRAEKHHLALKIQANQARSNQTRANQTSRTRTFRTNFSRSQGYVPYFFIYNLVPGFPFVRRIRMGNLVLVLLLVAYDPNI